MISPYIIRLMLLCLSSCLVINILASLLAAAVTPAVLRYAEKQKPRDAAGILFILRLAPAALAALLVLGFCVPSYLWLEPSAPAENVERIGLKCLLLAALCMLIAGCTILRAAIAVIRSLWFTRSCKQRGHAMLFAPSGETVLVIDHPAPLVAVAGIFRQRIIVSRVLLDALSPEEWDAVLRHEKAHRASRDNLKRLLLLLAPNAFPFAAPFAAVQTHWARFTEWAADDAAASGDPLCAVSLASALLCFARMDAAPRVPALSSPLLCGANDLTARVDRLLRIESPREISVRKSQEVFANALIAASIAVAAMLLSPAILPAVHELLEHLVR